MDQAHERWNRGGRHGIGNIRQNGGGSEELAALKNSVVRFQRDEDDPDVKAGYELFRRDISFIEGKDYFELDEVNRCTAKYMLRNGFMRYEPPTGIDRRLVITRLGRRMMDRK